MHPSLIRALAIALLLPALASAQSLNPAPSSPTASRQATTLKSAPATRVAPVSSSLDDRPQSPAHKPAKTKPAPANGANAAADRRPVKLYDRGGRVIPGALQVGPNRVLDTRSGRYYSTVPSGDGQRIDE
ncbi:hypothetical protein [Xanthomonas translucens]|uniref:Hypothetical secreted protein n=1 Tax=Xanthomonas translucens pv. translucens DSM 18974 TaxID=1261556 RepID=A0A1C3TSZ5_XANCT|nr:hypothetical protein [Xanthomonas translucens]AKK69066.1 ankyrin [Xanthomonas translucens pv. undulosa]AVY68023.1 ankyrin [Xanthomonas translucens pv. undulosa]ELQ16549.1 hypothetical protein A989_01230 [Xanthomonas translucens DAR61454]MBC3972706.1 hypothetical protein [Xanthomonas translucens pv. undulosa]MCC8448063.1 hypothetical protein [Xanthomonas translucens pv. translucens]